jgi:adenosylmethionine-8-amino-7-oxononanoate aminotransferase
MNDPLHVDAQHIWHPYASMPSPLPIYPVTSAKGVVITLEDGRKLVDGMSSWWSAIHGYNHPVINAAAKRQLDEMSHIMFGGLTHQPAVSLATELLKITPETLQTIFFADSGSVSVEVAIKMALQYWQVKGKKKKSRLATIRSGYHGDTFGAMAVSDPVTGMHELFSSILPKHFFAAAPQCKFEDEWDENDISSLKTILKNHAHEIGAVILEPIVQGAGGMRFYSPEYLRRCRVLCDEYDVLLIFDEIATGFGRTGHLFAADIAKVSPDIMCIGKGLTGGYMTMAATLTTKQVSDTISDNGNGIFMHGPTFMANPLACAVAKASLDLLLQTNWKQRIRNIENQLKKSLLPMNSHPRVHESRVLGAIGVLELNRPVDMKKIQPKIVEKGVWLRPFGKLVYTMPPFIIEGGELEKITNTMCQIVSDEDIF